MEEFKTLNQSLPSRLQVPIFEDEFDEKHYAATNPYPVIYLQKAIYEDTLQEQELIIKRQNG